MRSLTAAVRSALIHDRSVIAQTVWVVALVATPTLLRMLLDPSGSGIPFMTYWPSLLLASLLLDLPFAILFAVTGAMTAQWLFNGGMWLSTVNSVHLLAFFLFWFSAFGVIAMAAVLRAAIRDLTALAERQEGFNRELRHRSRNMLSIIQALAERGPRADNPLDFFREFCGRLEGLSQASDLLRIGSEAEGRLPDIIERTVAPFGFDSRIRTTGEPCVIPNESCIPLIMALHELSTNAVKHGALSQASGWIDVSWFIAVDGSSLYVLWKETGGPRVAAPTRDGTGMRLLRAQAGLDAVELTFDPRGLWCEIMIVGAHAIDASA